MPEPKRGAKTYKDMVLIFMYKAEENKQMIARNERKETVMERMWALSPVTQGIKKPAAYSMLSVLISLN